MQFTSWARRGALGVGAGLAMLVSACGGGGGGDSTDATAMQVSFDTSSMALSGTEGLADVREIKVIHASASGGVNESVYVGAVIDGQGIQAPVQVDIDTASRSATISVQPDVALGAGTYTGHLRLLACKDPNCNTQLRGSPHDVTITTTIAPRLKASVPALVFAAAETAAVAAKTVDVSVPPAIGGTASASVEYASADHTGWLAVSPAGTGFSLQPAAGLPAGSYQATLVLAVADARQTLRIPVTLGVLAGMIVQSTLDLQLTTASPASVLSGVLPVKLQPGVVLAQWTASSDAPWIVLDAKTGAPGTPVPWHVDPQEFAALSNLAKHQSTITVSGAGLSTRQVTVTLDKQMAELSAIDRLAVLAGEAGEVLLYGDNFDQLTNPLQSVAFGGGVSPTSAQRLGPHLMSLQVPGLAAGTYDVSLNSASGIKTRGYVLQVLAAQPRGYQAVGTEGDKGATVWDPVSQTLFAINRSLGSLMGFRLGGTVGAPTATVISRNLPNLRGIALGRDGSLLALVSPDTLLSLATADLSTLRTRQTGARAGEIRDGLPLAVSGDARLWYASGDGVWGGLAVYQLGLDALDASQLDPKLTYTFYSGPWGAVSPNGQRMLMPQSASISPSPPMLRRDAVDGRLTMFDSNLSPSFFTRYSSDRRGKRWLLDGFAVYDFDLGLEGRIALPTGWFGVHTAMSRDGSRAYVYTLNANAIGTYSEPNPIVYKPRVYVLDTSTPLVTTVNYPVLGYIELADYSSCLATQGPVACEPYSFDMRLTDDDRTLLVIGDRRLVVAPVPDNLRGGVLAAQAPQALRRLPAAGAR